jgi:hypothetical protein
MYASIPAIAGYDPYIGRAIGSLRVALAKGYPVMVRLHPGREYETYDETDLHTLDKEGHAILIVGYDDLSCSFEIIDPARGGRQQLPYDEFGIRVVDSTLDFALLIAPLQIEAVRLDTPEDLVKVSVGLFTPATPVVDETRVRVKDIRLITKMGPLEIGTAVIGQPASVTVSGGILSHDLDVEGKIEGNRPLPYSRPVRATVPCGAFVVSAAAQAE